MSLAPERTCSPSAKPLLERLNFVTERDGVRAGRARAAVANGLARGPDRRTLSFSDSHARRIRAFDFDLETTTLSSQRVFAQFSLDQVTPDGAAVDADRFYWCALYGGARVVWFSPDDSPVDEIRIGKTRADNEQRVARHRRGFGLPNEGRDGREHAVQVEFRLIMGGTRGPRHLASNRKNGHLIAFGVVKPGRRFSHSHLRL